MMEDTLLKLLHDDHVITDEQYQQALQECEKSHLSSDAVLEKLEILHENQLLDFLGKRFRMSVIDWDAYAVDQELLKLVPEDVATKYTVFPYALERGKRQGKITLAVANPSNVSASVDIGFMTGCIVKTEIASVQAIQRAIQVYYRGQEVGPGMPAGGMPQEGSFPGAEFAPSGIKELDSLVTKLVRSGEVGEEEADVLDGLDREHPSTKFLLDLLDTAVERRISEIHIEPYDQRQQVRFNFYGFLQRHTLIPDQVGRGIGLRLHRLIQRADIPGSTRKERTIQTGSFYTTRIRGKLLTVLVNFYPTPFGEKILLKIKDGSSLLNVEELGIDEKSLKTLNRILTKPQGLLLIVGSPRHGKTTTLYSIMRKYSQSDMNIVSLEHPVEFFMPGVNQIPFHSEMSYQDWYSLVSYTAPDLIALETVDTSLMAQLAFELASSALVLASVTAHNLADGICSFLSYLLAALKEHPQDTLPLILDSINGIVAQRLMRTICPHCKEEALLSDQDVELLRRLTATESDFNDISVFAGKGCHECMNTGYRGQTGLFEIIKLDARLKQFLLENQPVASFQLQRFLAEMAFDTFKQQGFQKISRGITSPDEIRRVVFR